ncbi:MAG: hypothetical protein LBT09_04125 [Planctomycetaceae bacterium]|nr:hypothetical protein [Planctomycetaceae bacterium]
MKFISDPNDHLLVGNPSAGRLRRLIGVQMERITNGQMNSLIRFPLSLSASAPRYTTQVFFVLSCIFFVLVFFVVLWYFVLD